MEITERKLNHYYDNIDNVDFNIIHFAERYNKIANYLIDNKMFSLSRKEAKFLIKYFAKKSLVDLGIKKEIKIKILGQKAFNRTFDCGKTKAMAVTQPNKDRVFYSGYLVDEIVSGNPDLIFRGFRTVFHEIKHIEQYNVQEESFRAYVMALEDITSGIDNDFYMNNYYEYYRENDAEEFGRKMTGEYLSGVEKLVDKREFSKESKDFERKNSENVKTILGRMKSEDGTIISRGKEYEAGERIKIIELIAEKYISKYPKEAFKKYPILKIAFKKNGERKSDVDLINEESIKISKTRDVNEQLKIKNFYSNIIMQRYSDDYENDIRDLIELEMQSNCGSYLIDEIIESKQKEKIKNKEKIKKQLEFDLKYYGIGLRFKDKLRRKILKYWANKRGRVQKKLYKQPQYFLDEGNFEGQQKLDQIQQYKVDFKSCNYKVDNSIDNISANKKKDMEDKNR